MKDKDDYLVYKHTSPSGKMYIGITNNYGKRSIGHRCDSNTGSELVFHKAIRKYGWDSFKHEIIIEGISKDEACRLEQVFIRELGTMVPNGYNMTLGGYGTQGLDSAVMRYHRVTTRSSNTKCYSWDKATNKFRVAMTYLNKTLFFGQYVTEDEAKEKADYLMALDDVELLNAHEKYKAASKVGKGCCFNKKSGKYDVYKTVKGKRMYFGAFANEEEAIDKATEVKELYK